MANMSCKFAFTRMSLIVIVILILILIFSHNSLTASAHFNGLSPFRRALSQQLRVDMKKASGGRGGARGGRGGARGGFRGARGGLRGARGGFRGARGGFATTRGRGKSSSSPNPTAEMASYLHVASVFACFLFFGF